MQVFISSSCADLTVAQRLAQALQQQRVTAWVEAPEVTPAARSEELTERAASAADGFVFLLHDGSTDRKQELEWRSILQSEWDWKKPKIPVILGHADIPPFLRDRVPVRIRKGAANYDKLARWLVHLLRHPEETKDPKVYQKGRAEQQRRLGELKRFAAALKEADRAVPESGRR